MLFPHDCPAEIWEHVMTFLCTRDIVLSLHTCKCLYTIAERVRKRRQNVQQLLSKFVEDVEGFRQLMRKTGGILVGEIATVFFTGTTRTEVNGLDVVLHNANLEYCANSWFSFLKGKTTTRARRYSGFTYVDQKVCTC
jgi:hypothetical protein